MKFRLLAFFTCIILSGSNFYLYALTDSLSILNKINAAPVLAASVNQPTYPGTNMPYLKITPGSKKKSSVSGVINDPTDPAAVYGIIFTVTGTGITFTKTTSKAAVVPLNNIIISGSGGIDTVKIIPVGVGYSNITLVAKNTDGSSEVYTINYAASAPSAKPANTFFYTQMADASGASAIDDDYMFACDDEQNVLRLYNRHNSGKELYSFDITGAVGASEECDLEGSSTSVRFNANKRLYWIGSLGNSKSGNLKPDRNRIIATDVTGTGANATLSVKSYSTKMRAALISWGDANGWGFTASSASGIIPKRIDGFNVEALAVTHAGETAYIGFRAPCVPIKGTTPTSANRKYAIVAPVTNFETIMNGSGNVSTTPTTGEPILFDLGGLGIRSMEKVGSGKYLIVAGLYTGGGSPAVYLWDGVVPPNPGITPITTTSTISKLIKLNLDGLQDLAQVSSDGEAEGHPEAMIADTIGNQLNIYLICDNGTVDYYNDGTEAKSLDSNQFKKFRYDKFIWTTDSAYLKLCPPIVSTMISSSILGSTYAWQLDSCAAGCYSSTTGNSYFTGSNTANLQFVNVPTSYAGFKLRSVVDGTYGQTFIIKFVDTWLGTIDNKWEVGGNWSCGVVPDQYTDVIINQGTPILHSNTAIRSIAITNTANLTIDGGFNLIINH